MRPKIEDIYKGSFDIAGAGVGCPCGAYIYSAEQLTAHWTEGHFDEPEPPPALSVHITDGVGTEDKVGG
jgi:hypothetical protein